MTTFEVGKLYEYAPSQGWHASVFRMGEIMLCIERCEYAQGENIRRYKLLSREGTITLREGAYEWFEEVIA